MNKERVSIIGLGWLGKPLALLLKNKGFQVKGSTTSADKIKSLNEIGLDTFLLKFSPHPEGRAFQQLFDTDILFINIPPSRRTQEDSFHPEQIKYLKALAQQHKIPKIIYVSATSVYPDENKTVFESDELTMENTPNPALLGAEQLLWKEKSYDLTVIRYGGLLGVDRIPGKYFSDKENVVGETPVNYIHQEDAVSLAEWIITHNICNTTINGVAPQHPERKDIYEKNAKELGFPPPNSYKESGVSPWKIVNADKIQETGFEFKYSDPLEFTYVIDQ